MIRKLLLILMVLSAVSCSPERTRDPFTAGRVIPELRFKDIDGNPYFYNDFKGKVVLINHWATWCQYCLIEMPHLQKLREKYSPEELEIITVLHDPENLDLAKDIRLNYQTTLPILLADHPILNSIEASGLPFSMLLDRVGTIRFIHHGFTPADIKKYEDELNYLLGEK